MNLNLISPKKIVRKKFAKPRVLESDMVIFKNNLKILLSKINEIEHEENQKNHLRDFLLDTYYKSKYEVNTKDRKDLVIHLDKTDKSNAGIIIEAKRPGNFQEMINKNNVNAKAFHEIILYYFDERVNYNNNEIKHLIITNVYEWFIFDANDFDRLIYRNKELKKLFQTYTNDKKENTFFYNEVAKIIPNISDEIDCIHFDIRDYQSYIVDNNPEYDKKLIALQKLLSPDFLLKIPDSNDSNELNQNFYKELLYILGLEEVKHSGKHIIRRIKQNRQPGSLIENTIDKLDIKDSIFNITDIEQYGKSKEEQLFNVALELCLTWTNRVLFLKLLEGLLLSYHDGDTDYAFLNSSVIQDYDELFKLFHQVLALDIPDRREDIQNKFNKVPYLNSSLFELSDLEHKTIDISSLDNSASIELFNSTVLKNEKREHRKLKPLDYLLKFLDAYDFSSGSGEEIINEDRPLINAAVLGKVFEKINGYQDGSFFTPVFITMYMSRKALRLAITQKFNEYFKDNNLPEVDNFEELYNALAKIDIKTSNEIVNSIRICDPAVGSGHFLVSALNELIVIKHELGILTDINGKLLRGYVFEVDNDELKITFDEEVFKYNPKNSESQRIQQAIFHEKQTLIENCLFGVDINPNSVKICRLRLWIELLKNSFYKPGTNQLETLPNIDINIKNGNSLVSRFALDSDLSKALKTIKYDINSYREFVASYKNEKNRETKRGLQKIIDDIKQHFKVEISKQDPKKVKLRRTTEELEKLLAENSFFELDDKLRKRFDKKKKELETTIEKLSKEIEEIENNKIINNAFEWRFEFPEVLDDNGDFIGFDVVIGNPPYIQLQKDSGKLANILQRFNYGTFERTGDIYTIFYEKGIEILKINRILSYITSNKWMRAGYGESLRKFFLMHNPLLLIDLGPGVFESATVDSNIMMIQKLKHKPEKYELQAVTLPGNIKEINLSEYVENHKVNLSKLDHNAWFIGNKLEQQLKEKIERLGKPLKEWDVKIYRGVLTGYNEAFIITTEKRNEILSNCKDEDERERTAEIIKPILRGRDIKRYHYNWANLWVINTHNGYKTTSTTSDKTSPQIKPNKFPSLRGVSERSEDGVLERTKAKEIYKKYKSLLYNPALKKKAQALRKAGNLSEVILWKSLRKKQFLNLDFHRQKIIGNYIVDFYCPEIDLVIEIDGYSHKNKGEYDTVRDEYLKSLGLYIFHFEDVRIKRDFENVLNELEGYCLNLLNMNTPLEEGNVLEVPPININDYTAIKEHLDKYLDKLEKRQDKGITPYNLRNCAYLNEFEKEKVVMKNIGKNLAFTITPPDMFNEASCFMFTGKYLKYILGNLNSSFIRYYIYKYSDRTGAGDIALKGFFIEKLPIPEITDDNKETIAKIENLVDQIITAKKQDAAADTSRWEREIDNLVYSLYQLSEEEIKIIEGERETS